MPETDSPTRPLRLRSWFTRSRWLRVLGPRARERSAARLISARAGRGALTQEGKKEMTEIARPRRLCTPLSFGRQIGTNPLFQTGPEAGYQLLAGFSHPIHERGQSSRPRQ